MQHVDIRKGMQILQAARKRNAPRLASRAKNIAPLFDWQPYGLKASSIEV